MRPLLVLTLALGLSACATITADTDQKIGVVTEPAGASCTLSNKAGSWNIAQTPGSAMVKRNFSPLAITCTHGTDSANTTLEPKTRGRAYGNILLGGVPAIVDAQTGDGYTYAPTNAMLKLIPASGN